MAIAWTKPDWPAPANIRALSTQRGGGVSAAPYATLNLGDHVGDAPGAVAENRLRLMAAAALPAAPSWLQQVHGTAVVNLDAAGGDAPAGGGAADASYTRSPGRVCAILTADCLPILFASDDGSVVGAAHAGWRGLAAGIIGATVRAMGEPAAQLMAWLGPAIGAQDYEVGAEVRDQCLHADPAAAPAFVANARGRFFADLPQIARRQLSACGITRLYGASGSTLAEPMRYFSHRRDGTTGRQVSLIWLAASPAKSLGSAQIG